MTRHVTDRHSSVASRMTQHCGFSRFFSRYRSSCRTSRPTVRAPAGLKSKAYDMLPYPDRCPICGKPVPSEANLRVLRAYLLAGAGVGAIAGAAFLPFIGFGLGGVAAGSFAAYWQSTIGAVTAGSLFALMQSLGATGLGTLLFGSIGSAICIVTTYADKFGFCGGHPETTVATSDE